MRGSLMNYLIFIYLLRICILNSKILIIFNLDINLLTLLTPTDKAFAARAASSVFASRTLPLPIELTFFSEVLATQMRHPLALLAL